MSLKDKFKQFEEDPEVKAFTRQLVHTLLLQIGFETPLTEREKTSSALDITKINPLFNLLINPIYERQEQSPDDSKQLSERKRKDRNIVSDSSPTMPQINSKR